MSIVELDESKARETFDRFFEWIQGRRSSLFQIVIAASLAAVGSLIAAAVQNQLASTADDWLVFALALVGLSIAGAWSYLTLMRVPSDYLAQLSILLQLLRIWRQE